MSVKSVKKKKLHINKSTPVMRLVLELKDRSKKDLLLSKEKRYCE